MKRLFVFILMLLVSASALRAQEIRVMGKVVSTVDDGPLGGVYIWVFKTVGAGNVEYKAASEMFDNEMEYAGPAVGRYEMTMEDGTFNFVAEAGGALLFHLPPFKPVFVPIKGRNNIPTVKIEATTVLDDALLIEDGMKKTRKSKPVVYGNRIESPIYYYFDEEMLGAVKGVGKENARFVVQSFVVNADCTDTLHYFPPRVYDGEQFHKTQYHWHNDYLYDIAETMPPLTADRDTVEWTVSYELPNDDGLYYGKAHIWVEDYNNVYYKDTVDVFNSGRVARPFQFLEYGFEEFHLDREEYFKEPKMQDVSTPKNMKLKFLVNKAELDRSDAATMASLDSLKREIQLICSNPDYTMNEIYFNGYSSPDGQYAKNKPLSDARTNAVFNEVWSVVPHSWRGRIFHKEQGHVAPWSEVVTLLEKQGKTEHAADVKAIIDKYPDDIDRQGQQMKTLKYYSQEISPLLDELRSVKCEYKYTVFRYLEPEEILKKYNEEPEFRNGVLPFTLNEYWHLFELVKDEKEREALYIRALAESFNSERKFWPLPANNLAVQKLKRKEADTLLLSHFINEKYRANQPWTENGKKTYPKNPDPIVANQVQMLMLMENYKRADELSSIIENEHPMLRAIVRCLGGYVDVNDPKEKATIDMVKGSSPRNEVVIKLLEDPKDTTIFHALNKLPQDQPVTLYLRAQHLCLKYDNDVNGMKRAIFDRDKDPNFSHPKDEIIPPATQEEIDIQKQEVERIKMDMEGDILLFGSASEDLVIQLKAAEELLAVMEKGETGMKPHTGFSDYEAAKVYLQRCFEMNKKFISTAKADLDIAEDLLNDVLGIETDKK
ncbi:MAG: hypothetical protein IJ940_04760 [Bacteroidales bacterium]|nr:hypothetical protein [Bacteroidales bacterium]